MEITGCNYKEPIYILQIIYYFHSILYYLADFAKNVKCDYYVKYTDIFKYYHLILNPK